MELHWNRGEHLPYRVVEHMFDVAHSPRRRDLRSKERRRLGSMDLDVDLVVAKRLGDSTGDDELGLR
jgi:hypothetical protein